MKRFLKYLPVAMLLFLAACSKGEDNPSRPHGQPEQWGDGDTIVL